MAEAVSKQNSNSRDICGLILCAGSGLRTGLNYNKLLHYIGRKTILEMTLDRFFASSVTRIILVASQIDFNAISIIAQLYRNTEVILGGQTRTASVRAGLNAIKDCDVVVIHDGARPYIKAKIIDESIASALTYGSGVVAIPTIDTIKEVKKQEIVRSLTRAGLYNIQTPQTFMFDRINFAYNQIDGDYTDDSEVYQKAGYTPRIVLGDSENIKVTTPYDVFHPVQHNKPTIGVGFDVHKLVTGRKLILGGVVVPSAKGLLGHSDADVLCHAIMDALLSAAGLPDIGVLFPDNDPAYLNASSIRLLFDVNSLITRRGFSVGNISAVIMAQEPKLAQYLPHFGASIAKTLGIAPTQVNISATTTEQLGIIGKNKGMASSATCMLFK